MAKLNGKRVDSVVMERIEQERDLVRHPILFLRWVRARHGENYIMSNASEVLSMLKEKIQTFNKVTAFNPSLKIKENNIVDGTSYIIKKVPTFMDVVRDMSIVYPDRYKKFSLEEFLKQHN